MYWHWTIKFLRATSLGNIITVIIVNLVFFRSVRSEKNLLIERKQAKMAELEKSNLSVSKFV